MGRDAPVVQFSIGWADAAVAPCDGTEACERMRAALRDMRALQAPSGTECPTEAPTELAMLQREISGRLHEALWLVRQAGLRAARSADMLDECFGRGAEIEAAVESLRGIGRRLAKLGAARRGEAIRPLRARHAERYIARGPGTSPSRA